MPTAFGNAMLQHIATNQNQVFIMRPVGELAGLPMNTSDFMCLRQDEQKVFDNLNLAKKTCVLDYGCGIGRHLIYLREHFPNVDLHICGLDICEGLLNHCRETLPENSDFQNNLEGFQHQTYDLILFMGNGLGVLGDELSAIEMLTDLTNRLNPEGRILIETGNPFGNGYYSSLYTISFQGQEDPQFSWGYADKRWLTDFFGNLGCNVTFSPSNARGGFCFFAEVRRFNDDQNQSVKTSTSSGTKPNLKSGITPMEKSSPTNIKEIGAADSELNHPIATNNDKTTPMSNFDFLNQYPGLAPNTYRFAILSESLVSSEPSIVPILARVIFENITKMMTRVTRNFKYSNTLGERFRDLTNRCFQNNQQLKTDLNRSADFIIQQGNYLIHEMPNISEDIAIQTLRQLFFVSQNLLYHINNANYPDLNLRGFNTVYFNNARPPAVTIATNTQPIGNNNDGTGVNDGWFNGQLHGDCVRRGSLLLKWLTRKFQDNCILGIGYGDFVGLCFGASRFEDVFERSWTQADIRPFRMLAEQINSINPSNIITCNGVENLIGIDDFVWNLNTMSRNPNAFPNLTESFQNIDAWETCFPSAQRIMVLRDNQKPRTAQFYRLATIVQAINELIDPQIGTAGIELDYIDNLVAQDVANQPN
jgi:SAM-dependent methyltransferase